MPYEMLKTAGGRHSDEAVTELPLRFGVLECEPVWNTLNECASYLVDGPWKLVFAGVAAVKPVLGGPNALGFFALISCQTSLMCFVQRAADPTARSQARMLRSRSCATDSS